MADAKIQPAPLHALSFDIEDWFHLVDIDGLGPDRWDQLSKESALVERYTDHILQLCGEHNVRATFFILGWIAERYPALVRSIVAAGHEVGSHSHMHGKVYEMTPESFRSDLRRSLEAIGSVAGATVAGYRAPSFSITPGAEWAFDVLLEEGLRYDASLFPVSRNHGGYPAPRAPHIITTPAGASLPELPMSVMRVGPAHVAFSGGGYLRLLPPRAIRRGFEDCRQRGLPVVVYLHPRDFAADCPRTPMPLGRRFRSYVGLNSTTAKLRMLLERYRFDTCQRVLDAALGEAA